jgi:hypothetical protein
MRQAQNLYTSARFQRAAFQRAFPESEDIHSRDGQRFAEVPGPGAKDGRSLLRQHRKIFHFVIYTPLLAKSLSKSCIPAGSRRLTLGAFIEGGRGGYDSHNSFPNAAKVRGDGDTSYFGGRILGRYDFLSGSLSGLYFEASARLGRAETDFRTSDIRYNGTGASFETSGRYCGLHGGLGWLRPVSGPDGRLSLDLSARLLWTGQAGDTVTVSADRIQFSEADSLRLRAGGRLLYSAGERTAPYIGAYYEREFDGQVRTKVNGRSARLPSKAAAASSSRAWRQTGPFKAVVGRFRGPGLCRKKGGLFWERKRQAGVLRQRRPDSCPEGCTAETSGPMRCFSFQES